MANIEFHAGGIIKMHRPLADHLSCWLKWWLTHLCGSDNIRCMFQLENCLSHHVQTIRTSFALGAEAIKSYIVEQLIREESANNFHFARGALSRINTLGFCIFVRAANTYTYYSGAISLASGRIFFVPPCSQRCTCGKTKWAPERRSNLSERRNMRKPRAAALSNFFPICNLQHTRSLCISINSIKGVFVAD